MDDLTLDPTEAVEVTIGQQPPQPAQTVALQTIVPSSNVQIQQANQLIQNLQASQLLANAAQTSQNHVISAQSIPFVSNHDYATTNNASSPAQQQIQTIRIISAQPNQQLLQGTQVSSPVKSTNQIRLITTQAGANQVQAGTQKQVIGRIVQNPTLQISPVRTAGQQTIRINPQNIQIVGQGQQKQQVLNIGGQRVLASSIQALANNSGIRVLQLQPNSLGTTQTPGQKKVIQLVQGTDQKGNQVFQLAPGIGQKAGQIVQLATGGQKAGQLVTIAGSNQKTGQLVTVAGSGQKTQLVTVAGSGKTTGLVTLAGSNQRTSQIVTLAGSGQKTGLVTIAGSGQNTAKLVTVAGSGQNTAKLVTVGGSGQNTAKLVTVAGTGQQAGQVIQLPQLQKPGQVLQLIPNAAGVLQLHIKSANSTTESTVFNIQQGITTSAASLLKSTTSNTILVSSLSKANSSVVQSTATQSLAKPIVISSQQMITSATQGATVRPQIRIHKANQPAAVSVGNTVSVVGTSTIPANLSQLTSKAPTTTIPQATTTTSPSNAGKIVITVTQGKEVANEIRKISEDIQKIQKIPREQRDVSKIKELQQRLRTLLVSQKIKLPPHLLAGKKTTTASSSGTSNASVMVLKGDGQGRFAQLKALAPKDEEPSKQSAQDKANRIVAEAIARAKMAGHHDIPKVMENIELPAVAESQPKKKKSREKKPKTPKEKRSKEPKPPRPPKKKKVPTATRR